MEEQSRKMHGLEKLIKNVPVEQRIACLQRRIASSISIKHYQGESPQVNLSKASHNIIFIKANRLESHPQAGLTEVRHGPSLHSGLRFAAPAPPGQVSSSSAWGNFKFAQCQGPICSRTQSPASGPSSVSHRDRDGSGRWSAGPTDPSRTQRAM